MRTSRQAGFTLIELMIAMTILSFIALGVYQNTAQTFTIRENVEQDGDFYNALRVGLDVLGRDLTHVYSPQSAALPGALGKAAAAKPQDSLGTAYAESSGGSSTSFWGEAINPEGVRPSRLQGEGAKLSFVVNSHMRLFRDTAESDFARISYSLEDDRLAPKGSLGKALVKREDPTVFEDNDKSETEVKYTLITGVKSVEFKFLDGEKDTWYSRWDTTGMDHKGVFPAVVEITIEVYLPKSESTLKINQRYRPELPI